MIVALGILAEVGAFRSSAQVAQPPSTSPFAPPILTLERLVQVVEANHPKLLGADVERRIARSKRLEKQGAFDPSLFLSSDYLAYNSVGKLATTTTTDVGIEIPTPYGLKVLAGGRYHYGKVKSPDSSTGQSGEYFLMLKLPLLRGAGINEKLAAERQARIGVPIADQAFHLARVEIALKAIQVYWKWTSSARKLQVQQDLLKIAQARAKFITERVMEGELPKAELPLAEGEVQQRLIMLYAAERTLQQAALELGLYLFDENGEPLPTPTPIEAPVYVGNPTPLQPSAIEEGRQKALQQRPELKSLSLQKDQTQIDLRLAKNDRMPSLDLVFSPAQDTGLGGVGNTMKAGIMVSFPLLTRGADGRTLSAKQKLQKLNLEEQESRNRLITGVNDAVNAVQVSCLRYEAAKQALVFAKQAEENERERYRNGDSTLINVNLLERATAQAAAMLIDIEAEYEQAMATFRAFTMQSFLEI